VPPKKQPTTPEERRAAADALVARTHAVAKIAKDNNFAEKYEAAKISRRNRRNNGQMDLFSVETEPGPQHPGTY
jgi:hypothetical protein